MIIPKAPEPKGSFTKGQLYDLYQQDIDNAEKAVNAEKVRINRKSKCVGFVLAFLAIITTAGAATLIAVSGGPTNQILFFSGVAFGVGTIGFSVWLAIEFVKAGRQRNEQDKLLTGVKSEIRFYNDILEDIEKAKLSSDHVRNILKTLKEEQRIEFINTVYEKYYDGKESSLLNQEQKEIIKAIVQFPTELAKFDFEKEKLEFSRDILSHIPSNDFSKSLIFRLIKILQKQPGTEKTLALYPQLIAELYKEDHNAFNLDKVVAIYKEMDVQHKTHFLSLMKDDEMGVVNACVKETLTSEFGNCFDQEEEQAQSNLKSLVTLLAQFPSDCAAAVLENKEAWLQEKMLKVLWEAMKDSQKDEYVKQMALKLDVTYMKKIINQYTTPENVPEVFLKAIAGTPVLFAKLENEIGVEDEVIKAAFKLMGANDKKSLYDLEEKENSSLFKKRLNECLQSAKVNNIELSQPDNFVVHYFNKHTKEFKKSVVDNKEISKKEHQRRVFALNVLEYMDANTADEAILHIDEGYYVGVNNFVDMMNVLVEESNSTPPLQVTRKKLIARFAASQNVKDIRTSKIIGRKGKIPAEDSKEWQKVLEIVKNVQEQNA